MSALIQQSTINVVDTTDSRTSVNTSLTPRRSAWSAYCKSPGPNNVFSIQSQQPVREASNGRLYQTHHRCLGASLSLAASSLPDRLPTPLWLGDDTSVSRLLPRGLSRARSQRSSPLMAAYPLGLDHQCSRRASIGAHTKYEEAKSTLQRPWMANASKDR